MIKTIAKFENDQLKFRVHSQWVWLPAEVQDDELFLDADLPDVDRKAYLCTGDQVNFLHYVLSLNQTELVSSSPVPQNSPSHGACKNGIINQ